VARPSSAVAVRTAAESIRRLGLLSKVDHVLAAFSGGADSTALALILKDLGYRVTLAHVDHRMRADSYRDLAHCADVARRLGMDFLSCRVVVSPPTEAEARRVRYQALEGMRQNACATHIATGHTFNDEAETVKMRLDRGGFGLGIPARRGRIVRPILGITRTQTERVCKESGFDYLSDPSNQDLRFTRNRIRRQLQNAPAAETRRYVAMGAESRAAAGLLDKAVRGLAETAVHSVHRRAPCLVIDGPSLAQASSQVAHGLIRLALEKAGLEPACQLVTDIWTKVVPTPGNSLDLPGGLCIWSDQANLVIGRRETPAATKLPSFQAARPGTTHSDQWGLRIVVSGPFEFAPGAKLGEGSGPSDIALGAKLGEGSGPFLQEFDAESLSGPLVVRQWQPGDRFRPLRSGRKNTSAAPYDRAPSKKLQDLFVDEKVPRPQRQTVPVLTCGGEIAWVAGYRLDDRFKLTEKTRAFFRAEIQPL